MRSALSAEDPEFGEAIFGLARDLYDRGHPYAFGNRTSSVISGESPGEAILRDIVKESIRLRTPSIAGRALTTMMFACERLLPALPPRSATSFEKDRADGMEEYTEEEGLLRRSADEKHQVILWNYLNYFQEVGKAAVTAGIPEIVSSSLWCLGSLSTSAARTTAAAPDRAFLIGWCLSFYLDVVYESAESGSWPNDYLPTRDVAIALDDLGQGREVISKLIEPTAEFLSLARKHRRLDSYMVENAADVVWMALRVEKVNVLPIVNQFVEISRSIEALTRSRYPAFVKEKVDEANAGWLSWAERKGDEQLKETLS